MVTEMAVIGITGNIASGKSTFRELLARHMGADWFDADAHAKGLLETDPDVRARVCEALGAEAYFPEGSANRPWIRGVIFNNPDARRQLEGILHPKVRATWQALAETAQSRGTHLLVDIPLLFETHADNILPNVVTVACSETIQRQRLAARGLDEVTASQIVASQMPQTEKISRSPMVVWNDGTLDALEAQAAVVAAANAAR